MPSFIIYHAQGSDFLRYMALQAGYGLFFTQKLLSGEKIKIFNYGNCKHDFTYIDDIVEGIIHVMQRVPKKDNDADGLPISPYSIYNIGNSSLGNLMNFVYILAGELMKAKVLPVGFDIKDHMELVPIQPGNVPVTYADTNKLEQDYDFRPQTTLQTGLRNFAE